MDGVVDGNHNHNNKHNKHNNNDDNDGKDGDRMVLPSITPHPLRCALPDVRVIVGEEEQIFWYHGPILAMHSPYIDTCLATPLMMTTTTTKTATKRSKESLESEQGYEEQIDKETTTSTQQQKQQQDEHEDGAECRTLRFPEISSRDWMDMMEWLQPYRRKTFQHEDAMRLAPYFDQFDFPVGRTLCDELLLELFTHNHNDQYSSSSRSQHRRTSNSSISSNWNHHDDHESNTENDRILWFSLFMVRALVVAEQHRLSQTWEVGSHKFFQFLESIHNTTSSNSNNNSSSSNNTRRWINEQLITALIPLFLHPTDTRCWDILVQPYLDPNIINTTLTIMSAEEDKNQQPPPPPTSSPLSPPIPQHRRRRFRETLVRNPLFPSYLQSRIDHAETLCALLQRNNCPAPKLQIIDCGILEAEGIYTRRGADYILLHHTNNNHNDNSRFTRPPPSASARYRHRHRGHHPVDRDDTYVIGMTLEQWGHWELVRMSGTDGTRQALFQAPHTVPLYDLPPKSGWKPVPVPPLHGPEDRIPIDEHTVAPLIEYKFE